MVDEQQDEAQQAYIQSAWRDPEFHKLPLESRRSWMNATDPDFLKLTYGEQDKLFSEAYQKYAVAPPKPVAQQDARAEMEKASQAASAMADTFDPTAKPIQVPMSDQFTLNEKRSKAAGMRAIPDLLPSPEQLVVAAAKQKQEQEKAQRQIRPPLVMPGSTGPIPGQDQTDVGPDLRNVPRQIGAGLQQGSAGLHKLVHNAADVVQKAVDSDDPYTSQILSPIRAIPHVSDALQAVKDFTKPYQTVAEEEAARLSGGRNDIVSQVLRGAAQAPADLAAYGLGGEVLGPIAGMAAVDALREEDKGLVPALEAGAKGALTGGTFEMINPLTRPAKAAAGAAIGALPPALEGRSLEDVISGGLTMGGLAGMHGGPTDAREAGRTARDYYTGRIPEYVLNERPLAAMGRDELLYRTLEEQANNRKGDINMAGTELASRPIPGESRPLLSDITGQAQIRTKTPSGQLGPLETVQVPISTGHPAARPIERSPDEPRNRDERRARVMPPETMGSAESERVRDARARLSKRYFDKPFGELDDDERAAVDAGLRNGHGFAVQPGETEPGEPLPADQHEIVPYPISDHPDWQTWEDEFRRLHTVSPDTGQVFMFDRDYGWNPVGKPEAKAASAAKPAPPPSPPHPAHQPVAETETGTESQPQERPAFAPYWARTPDGQVVRVENQQDYDPATLTAVGEKEAAELDKQAKGAEPEEETAFERGIREYEQRGGETGDPVIDGLRRQVGEISQRQPDLFAYKYNEEPPPHVAQFVKDVDDVLRQMKDAGYRPKAGPDNRLRKPAEELQDDLYWLKVRRDEAQRSIDSYTSYARINAAAKAKGFGIDPSTIRPGDVIETFFQREGGKEEIEPYTIVGRDEQGNPIGMNAEGKGPYSLPGVPERWRKAGERQRTPELSGHPAARRGTGSMAGDMPDDWHRWSELQAKRTLTDDEWEEFVDLDKKYGPEAEGGGSQDEPAKQHTPPASERGGPFPNYSDEELKNVVDNWVKAGGDKADPEYIQMKQELASRQRAAEAQRKAEEARRATEEKRGHPAAQPRPEGMQLSMAKVKEMQDHAEAVLKQPLATDTDGQLDQALAYGNLDKALKNLPADFPPQMRQRLEVLRNKLREHLTPKTEHDWPEEETGGEQRRQGEEDLEEDGDLPDMAPPLDLKNSPIENDEYRIVRAYMGLVDPRVDMTHAEIMRGALARGSTARFKNITDQEIYFATLKNFKEGRIPQSEYDRAQAAIPKEEPAGHPAAQKKPEPAKPRDLDSYEYVLGMDGGLTAHDNHAAARNQAMNNDGMRHERGYSWNFKTEEEFRGLYDIGQGVGGMPVSKARDFYDTIQNFVKRYYKDIPAPDLSPRASRDKTIKATWKLVDGMRKVRVAELEKQNAEREPELDEEEEPPAPKPKYAKGAEIEWQYGKNKRKGIITTTPDEQTHPKNKDKYFVSSGSETHMVSEDKIIREITPPPEEKPSASKHPNKVEPPKLEHPLTYYTGSTKNPNVIDVARHRGDIGTVITPYHFNAEAAAEFPTIMVDNGVFSTKGFNEDRFRGLVDKIVANPELKKRVRFIVAPDVLHHTPTGVVGDAEATLAQFPKWARELHDKGLPVAFVAQNGLENMLDRIPWDQMDTIMVGGDTAWKEGRFPDTPEGIEARRNWNKIWEAAREHDVPIHVGRVNSERRINISHYGHGAVSVDGNHLAFNPTQHISDIASWLRRWNEKVEPGTEEDIRENSDLNYTAEDLNRELDAHLTGYLRGDANSSGQLRNVLAEAEEAYESMEPMGLDEALAKRMEQLIATAKSALETHGTADAEAIEWYRKRGFDDDKFEEDFAKAGGSIDYWKDWEKQRRAAVKDALKKGETVPKNVLKDFPDLQQGVPAARRPPSIKSNVAEMAKGEMYAAEPDFKGLTVEFHTPDGEPMTGESIGYKTGINTKEAKWGADKPVAVKGEDGKTYWVPLSEMTNRTDWFKTVIERTANRGVPAARPKDLNARIAELEQIVRGHAINAPEDAQKVHDALTELAALNRQRDDARIAVLEAKGELSKKETLELAKLRAGREATAEPEEEQVKTEEENLPEGEEVDTWQEAQDWWKSKGLSEGDFEHEQSFLKGKAYSMEEGRKWDERRKAAVIDAITNGEKLPSDIMEDYQDYPEVKKAIKAAAEAKPEAETPSGHPAARQPNPAAEEQAYRKALKQELAQLNRELSQNPTHGWLKTRIAEINEELRRPFGTLKKGEPPAETEPETEIEEPDIEDEDQREGVTAESMSKKPLGPRNTLVKNRPGWTRLSPKGADTLWGHFRYDPNGAEVQHAGHPTANYPYAITTADGRMVVAPNGRGFASLKDAMDAAEKLPKAGEKPGHPAARQPVAEAHPAVQAIDDLVGEMKDIDPADLSGGDLHTWKSLYDEAIKNLSDATDAGEDVGPRNRNGGLTAADRLLEAYGKFHTEIRAREKQAAKEQKQLDRKKEKENLPTGSADLQAQLDDVYAEMAEKADELRLVGRGKDQKAVRKQIEKEMLALRVKAGNLADEIRKAKAAPPDQVNSEEENLPESAPPREITAKTKLEPEEWRQVFDESIAGIRRLGPDVARGGLSDDLHGHLWNMRRAAMQLEPKVADKLYRKFDWDSATPAKMEAIADAYEQAFGGGEPKIEEEPAARPEPKVSESEKSAEPKIESKIPRIGDAVEVRVTTDDGDEWMEGEVHEIRENQDGEPVYRIETQNRRDPADKDFRDYRPEDVRPAPVAEDRQADYSKRLEENIAQARRRAYVDKVDEVAALKTVNQLIRELHEGNSAGAQSGKNSAIIHKNTETVGKGKKRTIKTKYLAVVDRPDKKNIQREFNDPEEAAHWATDLIHGIGINPNASDEVYRYSGGYGRASVRDLLRRGSLLNPSEHASAVAEAAARAIGRPGSANTIYSHALGGGAWVVDPKIDLAGVATKYAATLPRNLEHYHEMGGRTTDFQRDTVRDLLRGEPPKNAPKGWDWRGAQEHYERAGKNLLEDELPRLQNRIELAKDLNGGETSERIAESEKMAADAKANIERNLKAVKESAKEANAKEMQDLEPGVRASAEAYAKYGAAAFPDKGTKEETNRNRYAKFAELESSSWPAVMEHLGIEPGDRPERIALPMQGPMKLTKAEISALETADLANGTIRPADQGTAQKLVSRGWMDENGELTEKGRSAVYSHRTNVEELKAGLPMKDYAPKNRKLAQLEGRWGGPDAWGKVGNDIWYSNGHGAWKGEFPSHWPPRNKGEDHRGPDFERIMPAEKGEVTRPIGFTTADTGRKNLQTLVYFDGDHGAMDSEYYDHSIKQGVVKWTVEEGKGKAFQGWDKDGNRIALVMPMRVENMPENLKGKESEAPPSGNPAARKRNPKTGAISLDALTGGTPRWIQEDLIPAAEDVKKSLGQAADSIQRGFAPQTLDNIARRTGDAVREYNAERAHEFEQAVVALRKARRYFQGKNFEKETLPFLDKMEKGEKQDTPELQAFADEMRKQLDRRRNEVRELGTGKLQKYYTDYFPHLWKFNDKARDVFMDVVSRGPTFEGNKDWLKKRSIDSIAEGVLEHGLTPKYENPVDSVLAQMHQMDRYILAHKTVNWMKEQKLTRYVPIEKQIAGKGAGKGWVRMDDPIFTRYGSNKYQLTEFNDQLLTKRINDFAKLLGIKHERYIKPPEGSSKTAGYTKKGWDTVVTKFATPESVLIHEIGHQLEFRYHLMDALKGIKGVGSELRDLADLRYEGTTPSENYKTYVRNKDEKMANAIAALVYAPEKFKQVAPITWDALRDEMYAHKELRPFFDLERSMTLGSNTMEGEMPGIRTLGHYYIPEGSASVFRNFLKPGLRGNDVFRAYLGAANLMNQFQLGASAYHAGFTVFDSWMSKAALALQQASRGDLKEAAKNIGKVAFLPYAPIENLYRGHKLLDAYRTNPQTAQQARMVNAVVSGGGRATQDSFYASKMADKWLEAVKAWKLPKAALLSAPALADIMSRPVMEWMVPRMKLGAFADMAKMEMKRLDNLESHWKSISEEHYDEEKGYDMEAIASDPALDRRGKIEARHQLNLLPKSAKGFSESPLVVSEEMKRRTYGQAWDSVDNRMGQMVYDNQFFNKTLKDLMMASVRSVGWNIGTLKEHGGGVADLATIKKRLREGDPALTSRTAYLAATPIVVGAIGTMMTYLATGKKPQDQEIKDRFFPLTGSTDINGRDERRSLPTYMRDWAHLALAAEDRDPGAVGRMVTAKLHPAAAAVAELLNNEDYYGTKVIDKDHVGRSLLNWGVNTMTPFSLRAQKQQSELGESKIAQTLPFFGITPAPSFLNKTRMERYMDKVSGGKVSRESRTQEQFARGKAMRDITRAARLDDQEKVQELAKKGVDEGHITPKDAVTAYKRGFNTDPVKTQFKSMSAPQALEAMKVADKNELEELMPEFRKKLVHFLQNSSRNERDDIIRDLKGSGILPLIQQPVGHPASR